MNHLDDVPKKESFMIFRSGVGAVMLQHVSYWLGQKNGEVKVFLTNGHALIVEAGKAADFEAAMQRFAGMSESAYHPTYVLTQTPPTTEDIREKLKKLGYV